MEAVLLKLHLKHHAFYGAVLVGLWLLLDFLARVSATEIYTRKTCTGTHYENDGFAFCEEEVQTSLGWFAGAGSVVVSLIILITLFVWLTSMPNRQDAQRLMKTTLP